MAPGCAVCELLWMSRNLKQMRLNRLIDPKMRKKYNKIIIKKKKEKREIFGSVTGVW